MDSLPSWLIPTLVAVGVLIAAAIGFVVMVGAVVAFVVVRRRRPDPNARRNALEELGYRPVSGGSAELQNWLRNVDGATLNFEDRPQSWRWTVRLPRYNTMSLAVEEQAAVDPSALQGVFQTRNPELDGRFVFASSLAAQAIALSTNRAVGAAMLAVPHLSLRLGADELAIEDVGLNALRQVGAAETGTPKAIAAELAMHRAVSQLVTAMFRSLYTHSGTIFDEHR